MKLFATFLATALCLASSILATPVPDGKPDLSVGIPDGLLKTVDIQITNATSGLSNITFVNGAEVLGTLAEQANGDVLLVDANGKIIDPSPVSDSSLQAFAGIPWGLLSKLRDIIRKWGSRVLRWVRCMGIRIVGDCIDEFLVCAAGGVAPWYCVSGYACAGQQIGHCRF